MEITNILFAGVGGQGILTSSRVLALAAVHAGLDVKMSEVHGMAQRGGNVDTHVRIGKEVPSSLIPEGAAHFLVSFEKLEALRYMHYLRPDGVAFVCPMEIHPLAQNLRKDAVLRQGHRQDPGGKRPQARVGGRHGHGQGGGRPAHGERDPPRRPLHPPAHEPEDWEAAIRERFSAKVQEACLASFKRGVEYVSAPV